MIDFARRISFSCRFNFENNRIPLNIYWNIAFVAANTIPCTNMFHFVPECINFWNCYCSEIYFIMKFVFFVVSNCVCICWLKNKIMTNFQTIFFYKHETDLFQVYTRFSFISSEGIDHDLMTNKVNWIIGIFGQKRKEND